MIFYCSTFSLVFCCSTF